ncbi:60S ribosomal protein L14-2-like [Impatiens glandulifera]|uniref:60S ribosomal protein L14-2-like n=1 Tax=Impatiens glandulifera TaxID=253017 RepID=UPI001FB16FB7|nr:60S ribosomal protein L14-2-like [Impatiens glandulifera]
MRRASRFGHEPRFVNKNLIEALVDAPDMVRTQMNFKRLSLTVPQKKTLIAAMEAADVKNKWENSLLGRKLTVQKRRVVLNDFDRFKIMLALIKRAGVVRQEFAKLKKSSVTAKQDISIVFKMTKN